MFFRYNEKRDLAVMSGRLRKLGVSKHPGLLFRPRQEGYIDYAFGGRAGPSVDVINLFHELAHAAEFGPENFSKRAYQGGFRFYVPERWIYDRFCEESQTMQATDRELRTFAYQFHLLQLAGRKLNAQRFSAEQALAMRFMPDWFCVPGEDDEARTAYVQAKTLQYIEEIRPAEALSRLTGWLDETARHLRCVRDHPETLVAKSPRYRGEGVLYSPA